MSIDLSDFDFSAALGPLEGNQPHKFCSPLVLKTRSECEPSNVARAAPRLYAAMPPSIKAPLCAWLGAYAIQ